MSNPVRVLLVDDSAFLRHLLTKHLEQSGQVQVIGHAVDGYDALAKIPALAPDVVVLDVEMPHLDGLTALQRIMAECPTPVVMLSALTQQGARTTIQALLRGAVDFVPKPAVSTNLKSVIQELIAKIHLAAHTPRVPLAAPPITRSLPPKVCRTLEPSDLLIVIGASTGGPRALQQLLGGLPPTLNAAIIVVQHMPPGFTHSLAQRLDESCGLTVREASFGTRLARGQVLLAPGDFHLRLGGDKQVLLDQSPHHNHVRPSVDLAMESAACHYGAAVIGVMLTGMGTDGAQGAGHIKAAGGRVIAEHHSTCIVYGMPRAVIEAGLADEIVPLPRIAARLIDWIKS